MDWKTFIANIVGSLAWPLVVVFIVWLLKDKIGDLLPRLKKLKHKDTELEFIEGVKELVRVEKLPIADESNDLMTSRKALQVIANISPRSAVIEAYRIVEVAAVKAIGKAYPDLQGKDITKQVQISKMLRDKVLNTDRYVQLRELLLLRNKAAHAEDFSLTGSPIETYIDVALSIANELEHYQP